MKRWIPWITAVAIVGILAWTFVYLKEIHPLGSFEARLGDNSLSGIAIRFKDTTLVGRSNGRKAWQFKAAVMDLSDNRQTATFQNIGSGTLLQNGQTVASISAKKAIYDTLTGNLVVPGEATVKIEEGPTLNIRDVNWHSNGGRLLCKGGVSASLAGSTLQGDTLQLDLDKKELTITKVRGLIRL